MATMNVSLPDPMRRVGRAVQVCSPAIIANVSDDAVRDLLVMTRAPGRPRQMPCPSRSAATSRQRGGRTRELASDEDIAALSASSARMKFELQPSLAGRSSQKFWTTSRCGSARRETRKPNRKARIPDLRHPGIGRPTNLKDVSVLSARPYPYLVSTRRTRGSAVITVLPRRHTARNERLEGRPLSRQRRAIDAHRTTLRFRYP